MRTDLLKALVTLIAQDGIVNTDNQAAALERKKVDQKARGKIETCHLGYLIQSANECLAGLFSQRFSGILW